MNPKVEMQTMSLAQNTLTHTPIFITYTLTEYLTQTNPTTVLASPRTHKNLPHSPQPTMQTVPGDLTEGLEAQSIPPGNQRVSNQTVPQNLSGIPKIQSVSP